MRHGSFLIKRLSREGLIARNSHRAHCHSALAEIGSSRAARMSNDIQRRARPGGQSKRQLFIDRLRH
jgi:hypothetical protein